MPIVDVKASVSRLLRGSVPPWLKGSRERPRIVNLLIWTLVAVGPVVALWALVAIPTWQVDGISTVVEYDSQGNSKGLKLLEYEVQRLELENDSRRTIAQIVIGLFGLLALFVAWRRVRAMDRTVEVAEDGRRTERFTQAIAQLGATDSKEQPKLEIRLGGIYALERLARDSEKDHWTIMEVLTAYIRENGHKYNNAHLVSDPPPVRIDIQAILTVLGRRQVTLGRESNSRLDLAGTVLNFARLSARDSTGGGVDFSRASFGRAQLVKAKLSWANLSGADISEADLSDAVLRGANLSNTILEGTNFNQADLAGANLADTWADGARFVAANLRRADLSRADLSHANLRNAELAASNLSEAVLVDTNLYGANLLLAKNLTEYQLGFANGDPNTQLPPGLAPPSHWIEEADE